MTTDVDQQESTLADDLAANLVTDESPEDLAVDTAEVSEVEEPTVQEVLEALEPPPKWDKRYKEAFSEWGAAGEDGNPMYSNGRAWQEAMLELYQTGQGYTTQVEQERAQLRQQYEGLQQQAHQWNSVLQPYNDLFASSGMTPDQAVRQALGLVHSIRSNPQATFQRLAREAGLDLNTLANGQEWQSPEAKEIQDLKRQINQDRQARLRQEQQWQQQQVQRLEAENAQQIQAFAEAVDDNGNPLHPHLEAVESIMAQLVHGHNAMNSGTPPDLEAIYQHACKLSPEIAQAEADKAEADRLAKANAEAKKAAAAAKTVKAGSSGKEAPDQSLREAIKANMQTAA